MLGVPTVPAKKTKKKVRIQDLPKNRKVTREQAEKIRGGEGGGGGGGGSVSRLKNV
jgi:hypothetical protein